MFSMCSSKFVVQWYGSTCGGFSKPAGMCASWIFLVNAPRETDSWFSWDEELYSNFTLRLVLWLRWPWSHRGKTPPPLIGLRGEGNTPGTIQPSSFYLVFLHSGKTTIMLLDHLVLVMQGLTDVVEHFFRSWEGGWYSCGSWRHVNGNLRGLHSWNYFFTSSREIGCFWSFFGSLDMLKGKKKGKTGFPRMALLIWGLPWNVFVLLEDLLASSYAWSFL